MVGAAGKVRKDARRGVARASDGGGREGVEGVKRGLARLRGGGSEGEGEERGLCRARVIVVWNEASWLGVSAR